MAHRINFNDYLYLQGQNVYITGTGGLHVPEGTTAERPSVMKGRIRYNSEQDQFELGTDGGDVLVLNNRNDGTVWYSRQGGELEGTLVIKNHRILNNTGTAIDPSYSFYDYPHTGLYSPSADNISVILQSDLNQTPIVEMVRNDSTNLGQTVTINGNLVVEGEQSVLNTQILEVEDNRITLNRNGTSTGTSGIDIEGDGTIQATIHYDYSVSKWSINNSIITDSNQPVSNSDLTNKVYVDTEVGNVQQNLTDHETANDPHPQYSRDDDNLGTLTDFQLSRDNLNVYSQDEIDQLVFGSVSGALYESNLQVNGGSIPETDRINTWSQPQQFGNFRLGLAVNSTRGMSFRSVTNPAQGENILTVETSGTNAQFGVTNGSGTWAKDGLRVGNQYNSSMTDANGGVVIGAPSGDTRGSGTINAELLYRNGQELDVRYYTQTQVNNNISNAVSGALFEPDLYQNGGSIEEVNINSNVTGNRILKGTVVAANPQGKISLNPFNDASVGIWSTRVDTNGNFVWREENTNNIDVGYIAVDGGYVIGSPTGGSHASGSINAQTIYRNGEELDTRYYTQSELNTFLNDKIDVAEKASANGVATLNSNSKIPTTQLPALSITETYQVADIPARDNLVTNGDVQEGDVAIVQDDGNGLTRSYIYDGSAWVEFNSPGNVYSVNSQTGDVVLDYNDVNADQQGTAQTLLNNHTSATDPHTQYLRKDNALAGLTDIPASRTTLDVYSTTEVDNISDQSLKYLGSQLTDTDDINTLNSSTDVGTYWWTTPAPANAPSGTTYGVMYIVRDGTQIHQFVMSGANGGTLAHRRSGSGTLGTWTIFASQNYVNSAVSGALFEPDLYQNGGSIEEVNINSNVTGNRILKGTVVAANSQGKISLNPLNDGSVGIWSTRVDTSGNFVWREENTNNIDTGYIAVDGGYVIGSPTGGSQASGSINAQTIYRNGEELDTRYVNQTDYDNGNIRTNDYRQATTIASGATFTVAQSSLHNISDLRDVTVDLKVYDNDSGSSTYQMWIDGAALLTYAVDVTNSEINIINDYSQSLDVYIRIRS